MAAATYAHLVEAAQARRTGTLDPWTFAYLTKGGTWVIASGAQGNDDDQPHDLVAVLPVTLEASCVVPLRITVNPAMVAALREGLDS